MRSPMLALAALSFSISALAAANMAEAGRKPRAYDEGADYVVAESRHGNGTVRGAVRMTELGPQVQLPGGHWEYCRRSCSETLRVQSVDFNNPNDVDFGGKGTIGNECGIFGCLDIGFGGRRRSY